MAKKKKSSGKRRVVTMPEQFRKGIKSARADGMLPFITKAGDVGFAKMKRGATKGHRYCGRK